MPPKGSRKAATDDLEPGFIEAVSFLNHPKPFKNPNYTRSGTKRNRTVKQILQADRERERNYREQVQRDTREANQLPNEDTRPENLNIFYSNIESPPSVMPPTKYCDITGLAGPYTHPISQLRYHDHTIYEVVKSLNPSAQQAYLSARGLNSVV
ncbi:hypothetical protein DL93DRAFT_1552201 [Clavulina sp. PMI_390]|nr:hypothetical protein DL93DRAFT_1552201 [Clavulina sp. PMI_390]